jgi:alpha/beta superfamily hydrolase
MESPVVGEVAWACQKAGVASVRFNWRGVGASAGTPTDDPALADIDYRAALDFLAESVPSPLVAAGYSFGSLAAVRAAQKAPAVRRLILIAPPTAMLDTDAVCAFPGEIFMAVGENDEWSDADRLADVARQSISAHLEVITGCDHFFISGLEELDRALSHWWARGPA